MSSSSVKYKLSREIDARFGLDSFQLTYDDNSAILYIPRLIIVYLLIV